jgi:cobalt/nickel transport system permease protein
VLAAVVAAGELALSGVVPWRVAAAAMGAVHALIGVGEALITALVVLAIARTRPELLSAAAVEVPGRRARETLALGFLVALGIAVFVAPLASPWPDGLEKVAQTLGFADRAVPRPLAPSPMPDYAAPGLGSGPWATALAGAAGTALVFLVALAVVWFVVARRRAGHGPASR